MAPGAVGSIPDQATFAGRRSAYLPPCGGMHGRRARTSIACHEPRMAMLPQPAVTVILRHRESAAAGATRMWALA